MAELLQRLEHHLERLRQESDDTPINRIRNDVQEHCVKGSSGEVGFYSLTVPTGGGKTLASVLWALHHAVRNRLNRIIIAIPYTSIIVQTAATLRTIFGEANVLEHHSNMASEDGADDEHIDPLLLATENWDYPKTTIYRKKFETVTRFGTIYHYLCRQIICKKNNVYGV